MSKRTKGIYWICVNDGELPAPHNRNGYVCFYVFGSRTPALGVYERVAKVQIEVVPEKRRVAKKAAKP